VGMDIAQRVLVPIARPTLQVNEGSCYKRFVRGLVTGDLPCKYISIHFDKTNLYIENSSETIQLSR
jgi:hypothetical protein